MAVAFAEVEVDSVDDDGSVAVEQMEDLRWCRKSARCPKHFSRRTHSFLLCRPRFSLLLLLLVTLRLRLVLLPLPLFRLFLNNNGEEFLLFLLECIDKQHSSRPLSFLQPRR